MKGVVDSELRALIEVSIGNSRGEWFGNEYRTQIIANEGSHPLLGTMLLDGHDLSVSYRRKTVGLE